MDRATAVVIALLVAPVPLITLFLVIRGYDIHVLLRRRTRNDDR